MCTLFKKLTLFLRREKESAGKKNMNADIIDKKYAKIHVTILVLTL